MVRGLALIVCLTAAAARAQGEPTPPPPPPPVEPAPEVLTPPTIANPPLPPEEAPPQPPPPEQPEHFARRFGPMGHLALNVVNGQLPGLAGSLGLRFAMLPRPPERHFNVAVGGFFGLEAVNFVPTLGPGVRLELLGARSDLLLPYLSLSTFAQVLVPANGDPVGGRVGLAFSWNLVTAGDGRWFGWTGSGTWLDVPIAIVAAIITFGDLRAFLQIDAQGRVAGAFSIGFGF